MSSLRAALEQALFDNPDDRAAHAAYADLLAEQGDPRGEFIQVQLALEDPACTGEKRRELEYREQMLLTHEREWLGELAPHLFEDGRHHRLHNHWSWSRGWLDEVFLWMPGLDSIRALARCPAAHLLEGLELGEVGYQTDYEPRPDDGIPEGSEYPCLYPLLKAPFLANLRFFRLGEEVNFEEGHYNCRTSGEGAADLVARMPRLVDLQLLADETDLRRLFSLPNLTRLLSLLVYHDRDRYPLEALAANPALAALERLRLHPAHSYTGEPGSLPLEVITPLLRSPHLGSLKHLHLHGSSMGDAGCQEVVRSGVLRRLETLDLRWGCITEEGARVLASSPDVRRLKSLRVDHNQLTGEGLALLGALGIPDLTSAGQDEPGSDEYLYTGDME